MHESVTQVKALQANHDAGHAFLVQLVMVSVELLQQLHWGLLPPMDLSLMLPGIDVVCISNLFNLQQLVGSDHHPSYFEGAVVLVKSGILLGFDSLSVTSLHCLATAANPLQLGIPPESLLRGTAGSPTFLQNFQWVDCTDASLVSKHVRQLPQLLTQDQSQWHSPVSHCLSQTHHHLGWQLPH